MDSQGGTGSVTGSIDNMPLKLEERVQDLTLELDGTMSNNVGKVKEISAAETGEHGELSRGMGKAPPSQVTVVSVSQGTHPEHHKINGGSDLCFEEVELGSNSVENSLKDESADEVRIVKRKVFPSSSRAVEERGDLPSLSAAPVNHESVKRTSVETSNSMEATEASSCTAIRRDLAISGLTTAAKSKDAIISDQDLVLRHQYERTPGDGAENPLDAFVAPSTQTNSDTLSNTALSESDEESHSTDLHPAVLDVTSSEEHILGDLELQDENPSSPATIDVVTLSPQEFVSSNLKRPKSLEGCFNLDANSPRWTSPDKSHSLRTTPSASTPRFLDEFTEAGKAATDQLQETLSGLAQEGQFDSKNPRLSGILQHELRSRASFTSVSSLSTDYSSSLATDDLSDTRESLEPGFVEVSLHNQTSTGDHWAFATQGAKPKKRGLAGFLSRNLFPWKSSGKSVAVEQADGPTGTGWKLFSRSPAKQAVQSKQFDVEYPPKGKTHPPSLSLNWRKKQSGMRPASSTTALILENRPLNLPAKNPDEEQKHKEQYEEMVKGAKQKEMKVYKQQMKKLAKQLKYEEGIKTLLHVWQADILKGWDTVKGNKKTRDMWWQGIPPSIRGKVWMLAIGNELNITPELFEIFLARAKDRIKVFSEPDIEDAEEVHEASREDSVDVIRLDVSRTFPHLCIYQKGGPYFDRLHSVLGAYACYRPDIGYVQGMSFIAAVFLLYLEPADAFCCFANVLNKSCQLAFFRLDQPVMQSYFDTYEEYFEDNLPDLYNHFKNQCLTPDLYIIDWMYTLYTKSLPLDVACRFLDVFFRDGEEFIFRTALGILHLYEDILLSLEFIQIAQFLTKLPLIECEVLFRSIEVIDIHQKKFSQVLTNHMANNSHNQ
ncbi:TBC1 domain family member 14-like [Asterias rubens]|uniref:TBC1 domain family member 14-like n=1 Tax=Asterias rubens TaxID=7604 RepID=UPI001455D07C|nr:TBC1 domain family member 14-like [Asterias rubens]